MKIPKLKKWKNAIAAVSPCTTGMLRRQHSSRTSAYKQPSNVHLRDREVSAILDAKSKTSSRYTFSTSS